MMLGELMRQKVAALRESGEATPDEVRWLATQVLELDDLAAARGRLLRQAEGIAGCDRREAETLRRRLTNVHEAILKRFDEDFTGSIEND